GVIINTSSIAAFEGQIGQVSYGAAKAGIAGMSLPMARDLGSLGIRVLAIAPSLFATGLMEGASPDVIASPTKDAAFPARPGRPGGVRRAGRGHGPQSHAHRPDHPPGRRAALRAALI